MTAPLWIPSIIANKRSAITVEVYESYIELLPPGVEFRFSRWNLIAWDRRHIGAIQRNAVWDKFQNCELVDALKLFLLNRRQARCITGVSAVTIVNFLTPLDRSLGTLPFEGWTTSHFNDASATVEANGAPGTAFRSAAYFDAFGRFLLELFARPIAYRNALSNPRVGGRHGTESDKQRKTIPIEAVASLLRARRREGIAPRDAFFIDIVVILVAAGPRGCEVAVLRRDCLHRDPTSDAVALLLHVAKGNEPVPRWLPPALVPAVEEAIRNITAVTEPGRWIANAETAGKTVDWRKVYRCPEALNYFARNFLHEWTADPAHSLTEAQETILRSSGRRVDLDKVLAECGGSRSAAARHLGMSRRHLQYLLASRRQRTPVARTEKHWDNHPHTVSVVKFFKHTGVEGGESIRAILRPLVAEALRCQINGAVFPVPPRDEGLEARFHRSAVLLRDVNGNTIVDAKDALLVIPRYFLSTKRASKTGDYTIVTPNMLGRWLTGEPRGRGTGSSEDSVWSRLEIVDPETGHPYYFAKHAFRHFLHTLYERGGLSDEQIALIFGRSSPDQNATYDQTSHAERAEQLQRAVQNGTAFGAVATNFEDLSRTESRQVAEEYVKAATMLMSLMPHGGCLHNWADGPCPHNLGCLARDDANDGEDGVCEKLLVDRDDPVQVAEIERIHRDAVLMQSTLPESSPQKDYQGRVAQNTAALLRGEAARFAAPEAETWTSSAGA